MEGDTESVVESTTLRIFHYTPNKPLAIVSLVTYFMFMVYFSFRIFRTRSRRFLYIVPFTAFMELVGYLIRILCVEYTTIARYATMQLFILLAPNALALVNYKTIGEVIRLSEVKGSPFFLRSKFVTWFFFASDVFSFLLQGSGSGLQATGGKSADTGKSIILAGLFIQLIFLACFGAIVIYISRNDNYVFYVEGQTAHKKHLIACMSVTFIFIYIRSIYRVIEFSTGYDGPVAKAEWAFYVFDTLAIAICFIVYAVYFIGNYLPKCKDSEQASTRSISIDFTEAKKFHSQNV